MLIQVFALNTMLPAGFKFKLPDAVLIVNSPLVGLIALVLTLPAITLPVTDTKPPVNKLPPEILDVVVIVPVELIKPPVNKLPPVMLPVTLAVPPVAKLPPVTVPAALAVPPVSIFPR